MKRIILAVAMLTILNSVGAPTWSKTWSPGHLTWSPPPMGIPEPKFGIKEQAPAWPSEWPAAQKDFNYYIDKDNPNATDVNNTYGCPNKPRLTIPPSQTGIHLAAGSLVEIHGGPYVVPADSRYIRFYRAANPPTVAAPAFVRGFSQTGGMAEIQPSPDISSAGLDAAVQIGGYADISYVIVENIKFNGIPLAITGQAVDHIAVRDCEITGTNATTLTVMPGNYGVIHDIVVYHNWHHDTLQRDKWNDPAFDLDYHGVSISTFWRPVGTQLYNVWVLDSLFHGLNGDSIQVTGTGTPAAELHHIYIGRTVAYDNRQAGIGVKASHDVIVSQNLMYDCPGYGGQAGSAINAAENPKNYWVLFNEVYNCDYGFRESSMSGSGPQDNPVYVIGNYFHDLSQSVDTSDGHILPGVGVYLWQGNVANHVVNNTVVNCYAGIVATFGYSLCHLENNLVYNIKKNLFLEYGPYMYHLISVWPSSYKCVYVDHCLMYGYNDGNVRTPGVSIHWDEVTGSYEYTSLAAFQAHTAAAPYLMPQGLFCIEADPLLTTNGRLTAGSPARNNGTKSDAYQTFQDLYAVPASFNANIRFDFDGNPRPATEPWCIGAFEYTNKLTAPGNPAVEVLPAK